MSKKAKISLALVAAVAVFSIYKLGLYIHASAGSLSGGQEQSPLPSPDDDPDHDGLSNQQEVIWGTDPFNPDTDSDGFKDGEEVKSGHNPLVPGPNDLINQDNLTQQFSQLTVDGLAEGSLQPDNQKYATSLADITGSIADSAKYLFNKQVSDTIIGVTDSNTQTVKSYLESTAPFTQSFGRLLNDQFKQTPNNLNIIGENGFTNTIKSYYSDQATQYQNILEKGEAIKTPQNLKSAHAQFLSLVLQMHDISDALANGDIDPIKATFAFKALGGIYDKYFALEKSYIDALDAMHLDPGTINIPKP
jgi:hypothetical protein